MTRSRPSGHASSAVDGGSRFDPGRELRFGRLIEGTVHECAPDHSTHVIEVGELREAVAEMAELYAALQDVSYRECTTWCDLSLNEHTRYCKAARAAVRKARGEA